MLAVPSSPSPEKEKLYQEELMEHFKYPHNKKKLQSPSFTAGRDNPSCGDHIIIEGIIQGDTIVDLGFSGSGCVISQATASMLTQSCKNKTIDYLLALTKDDIIKLVGIQMGPTRLKCALLSLQVLHEGILRYNAQTKRMN